MSNGQIGLYPRLYIFRKTLRHQIQMPMSWHRSSRSESSVCSGSYPTLVLLQTMPLLIGYKNATSETTCFCLIFWGTKGLIQS